MNRQDINFEILSILEDYLTRNPDIRFGQALSNLNLASHGLISDIEFKPIYVDIFYEEPEETLKQIRQT